MKHEMKLNMKLEERFCTLCGPQAQKNVLYSANFSDADFNQQIFSARRTPDRRHFQLVKCTACEMIYSDPAGDPSKLAELYHHGLVSYDTQEPEIYNSYAPVLDQALKKLSHRGTFVEIGGGTGFMLRYGVEHGFREQIEIEPSQDAEKKFRPVSPSSKFIRGIFDLGIIPPNSASLICFFQVLDHITDPRSFLKIVHEALEPGGIAVCITHNTRALSAKILREKSPIFDIEHTYLFNLKNISALFQSVGFSTAKSFSIPNKYSVKHWLNLAPFSPNTKARVTKILRKTRADKLHFKLYAGNLAVIAQKERS